MANEDEIKAMFSLAKSQFGGIDVCVNNAGLAHDAPILSGSTADWKNMLEVFHHKKGCHMIIVSRLPLEVVF